MTGDVVRVLSWVLPPVLGALIGYVTNAVAIKMLFRPHREWRVLGIRVPFTPGIIPRQRGRLAESIAGMVSRELLTREAVERQTAQPAFQESIRTYIHEFVTNALNSTVSTIRGSFGRENAEQSHGFRRILGEILRSFLTSDGFRRVSQSVLEEGLRYVMGMTVGHVIGEGEDRRLVLKRVLAAVESEEARRKISQGAADWMQRQVDENRKIEDVLDSVVVERIVDIVERAYSPAAKTLVQWLRKKEMRAQLEMRGRFLLRDVFARLSAFQRILVTATQYDRTLDENMSGIIDDVLEEIDGFITDSESKEKFLEIVRSEISELWRSGLGDLNARNELDLPARSRSVVESLVSSFSKDDTQKSVLALMERLADSIRERTIESVLQGVVSPEEAAEHLSELIVGHVPAEGVDGPTGIGAFFGRVLDAQDDMRVADFLGVDERTTARISDSLTEPVIRVLQTRVPALLETLDIHELVVSRINGLDVEQVEGLLMRVIHRHLRWINVFGAILGFIIGLTQLATRLLS